MSYAQDDSERKSKQTEERIDEQKEEFQQTISQEHEILPRLFLGSMMARKRYSEYNLIINADWPYNLVEEGEIKFDYLKNRRNNRENRIPILKVGCNDVFDQDLFFAIPLVVRQINSYLQRGEKVLVHCRMGISRSVSLLIAYLIKYHQLSTQQALKLIRTQRSIANPNPGFLRQLKWYEHLMRKNELFSQMFM